MPEQLTFLRVGNFPSADLFAPRLSSNSERSRAARGPENCIQWLGKLPRHVASKASMASEGRTEGLHQEKWYEVNVNGYKDVGGHVEYCLKLCHCSGVRLIATPKILDLSPLQDFLGIRSPEPPAGLRVVPRANALELEVSPPDSDTFPALPRSGEDGGQLSDTRAGRNRLKREVGASGRLMQTARVGRLEAGRHCFACAAFNVAGCSSPVSVTVDPAVICGPGEQNPARMPVRQQPQPPTFANSALGRGYLPRPELDEGPAPLGMRPAANGWSGWGPSPGSGQGPVRRGTLPQESRPTNQLQMQQPRQPQLPQQLQLPQLPQQLQLPLHMQIQRQQQQQQQQQNLFQQQVLGPGAAPMGLTSAKSRTSKPMSSAGHLGAPKASNHLKDEEDEDRRHMRLSRVAIVLYLQGDRLLSYLRRARQTGRGTSEAGFEGGDSLWCSEIPSISEFSRYQVNAPHVPIPSPAIPLQRWAVSPNCAEILADFPEVKGAGQPTWYARFCAVGSAQVAPSEDNVLQNVRGQGGSIVVLDPMAGARSIEQESSAMRPSQRCKTCKSNQL
eukprot:s1364_g14.t1